MVLTMQLSTGASVDMVVRRSARARLLRMVVNEGSVELVAPPRMPMAVIERFAHAQIGWLEAVLKRQRRHAYEPLCVRSGARIPVADQQFHLVVDQHALKRPRVQTVGEELRILLPANSEFATRTEAASSALRHWLSAEAEIHAQRYVARLAPQIAVKVNAVGIRLARSRWGSCSARGRLMFNRILIHAPSGAFEYVVAHELAHLREMNHSPKFWAWVERLMPGYLRWEDYLTNDGRKLYRYYEI